MEDKYKIRNLSNEKERILNELERYETIIDYHQNSGRNPFIKSKKKESSRYLEEGIKSNISYIGKMISQMYLTCSLNKDKISEEIIKRIEDKVEEIVNVKWCRWLKC